MPRRNPAGDVAKQVLVAGITAVVTTTVAVLVTTWLTKKATLESVAKGETPLPAGATPTTTGTTPIVAMPKAVEQPGPEQLPQKPPPAIAPMAILPQTQLTAMVPLGPE